MSKAGETKKVNKSTEILKRTDIEKRLLKTNKNESENVRIIKRILLYIEPYKKYIYGSLGAAAVSSILSLLLPILTGHAIDKIVGTGRVDWDGLIMILILMIMVIAVSAAGQWIMNACNNHITFSTVRDVRKAAMKKINELPVSYFDKHPTGETVSRVIADVDQFSDGLLMGFTQFFTGIITILGTLILMLTINPLITLVVVLLTPLSFLVAAFIAKITYKQFKRQADVRGKQTNIITEMLEQEKVVKAFSYERFAEEIFNSNNEELARTSLKAVFFSSLTNPSTRFINNMVYAGVAVTGAISAISGRITVGGLAAFLGYANQYTKPFNEISGVVTELQNAIACAGRVFDLIDEEPRRPEDEDALILGQIKAETDDEKIQVRAAGALIGNISFTDVCFSYTRDKKLLQNVNVNAGKGQRIAIVGPTGCGKTTLINLLMRFYDVDDGAITIDGHDVRHLTRKSLRRSFGMVLQDTWLKPGTIRENIIMGKPDATEEEMIAAAKASHAHSFIRQLERGYDTVIGEDGGSLSQGQKQLICISRVMLMHPPMLILDEATSSIDTRTELKIQNAFAKLMEGRTSFIVAHRLSTIREADCILVMKDGNIIEQGDHKTLLQKGGFYSTLYKSQFEG